jgi:hypothetical protein
MTLMVFWSACRIQKTDETTGEVLEWSRPQLVPRDKVLEDNYCKPGVWKVLDQNPDGINNWAAGKDTPAAIAATNMGPVEMRVTAREAPVSTSRK